MCQFNEEITAVIFNVEIFLVVEDKTWFYNLFKKQHHYNGHWFAISGNTDWAKLIYLLV